MSLTMPKKRAAILSKDSEIESWIVKNLRESDYDCVFFRSFRDLWNYEDHADLSILVTRFEDLDSVSGRILLRRRNGMLERTPIIFVTSDVTKWKVVSMLDAGADAYIATTASRPVFLSYVDALVRRAKTRTGRPCREIHGAYEFDLLSKKVRRQRTDIPVNVMEFHLSLSLFRNLGGPISLSYLEEATWGVSTGEASGKIRTHVSNLKRKLGLTPENGYLLAAVRGYGYRLELISSGSRLSRECDEVELELSTL
ncbi:response regulator transcription factor [Burkholderia stabilis]|uniref:response regulator transcription factor n=1 Tax=Burkholderia stabilis TaxID=95485 RepID=UPI001591C222|nr:response regulator transcription factor [Burkholderia stabilis]